MGVFDEQDPLLESFAVEDVGDMEELLRSPSSPPDPPSRNPRAVSPEPPPPQLLLPGTNPARHAC